MSVFRINEFRAREGQGDRLLEALNGYDAIFKFLDGYQSIQVLQSLEEPDRIVVIEKWDSIEANQTAAKKIPVHVFETVMRLSVDSPKGGYYHQ